MKIAHIVPNSISFPLTSHNGRYEWVRQLASLQAAKGHEVTVYGGPSSHIDGVVCKTIESPSNDKRTNNIATFHMAFLHEHDVYHSHFDNLHYQVAGDTKKPIVYTQHWWPDSETVRLAHLGAANVWAVPPTQFMYDFDSSSGIQSKGYIYHGIDLTIFRPVTTNKSDRLLYVGRISPEKNIDIAISVARKAGVPLDIVGKVSAKNQSYWEKLQPFIDGDMIRYLGQKNHDELVELYSSTAGALFPLEPTEPFGLVAIEAQACGAPVVMKAGGSRGELLQEGVTGFLCETEEEFVKKIHQLYTISSENCVSFAQKFGITAMFDSYQKLYESLID